MALKWAFKGCELRIFEWSLMNWPTNWWQVTVKRERWQWASNFCLRKVCMWGKKIHFQPFLLKVKGSKVNIFKRETLCQHYGVKWRPLLALDYYKFMGQIIENHIFTWGIWMKKTHFLNGTRISQWKKWLWVIYENMMMSEYPLWSRNCTLKASKGCCCQ